MELYFIRHAQSENNALWESTHSSDGRHPDPTSPKRGYAKPFIWLRFSKPPEHFQPMRTAAPIGIIAMGLALPTFTAV